MSYDFIYQWYLNKAEVKEQKILNYTDFKFVGYTNWRIEDTSLLFYFIDFYLDCEFYLQEEQDFWVGFLLFSFISPNIQLTK